MSLNYKFDIKYISRQNNNFWVFVTQLYSLNPVRKHGKKGQLEPRIDRWAPTVRVTLVKGWSKGEAGKAAGCVCLSVGAVWARRASAMCAHFHCGGEARLEPSCDQIRGGRFRKERLGVRGVAWRSGRACSGGGGGGVWGGGGVLWWVSERFQVWRWQSDGGAFMWVFHYPRKGGRGGVDVYWLLLGGKGGLPLEWLTNTACLTCRSFPSFTPRFPLRSADGSAELAPGRTQPKTAQFALCFPALWVPTQQKEALVYFWSLKS